MLPGLPEQGGHEPLPEDAGFDIRAGRRALFHEDPAAGVGEGELEGGLARGRVEPAVLVQDQAGTGRGAVAFHAPGPGEAAVLLAQKVVARGRGVVAGNGGQGAGLHGNNRGHGQERRIGGARQAVGFLERRSQGQARDGLGHDVARDGVQHGHAQCVPGDDQDKAAVAFGAAVFPAGLAGIGELRVRNLVPAQAAVLVLLIGAQRGAVGLVGPDRGHGVGGQHARAVQFAVSDQERYPPAQVAHRGVLAARGEGVDVFVRQALPVAIEAGQAVGLVAGQEKDRVAQAHGSEHAFERVGPVVLAGRAGHHAVHQGDAVVVVLFHEPWRKIGVVLGQQGQHGRVVILALRGGDCVLQVYAGNAGLVGQEGPYRDGRRAGVAREQGERGNRVRYRVLQGKAALLGQGHDGQTGKGFGQGGDPVDRVRPGRNAAFAVGHAEALDPDRAAAVHQGDGQGRHAALGHEVGDHGRGLRDGVREGELGSGAGPGLHIGAGAAGVRGNGKPPWRPPRAGGGKEGRGHAQNQPQARCSFGHGRTPNYQAAAYPMPHQKPSMR